jgi:type VI protein secretion system component VasK
MRSFLRLPAAGILFFVSAWILMLFAGITTHDTGIKPFGYITSMILTVGLWLTLAPAIGAVARPRWRWASKRWAEAEYSTY